MKAKKVNPTLSVLKIIMAQHIFVPVAANLISKHEGSVIQLERDLEDAADRALLAAQTFVETVDR